MSNEEVHELEEISTVGSTELSIDPPIPAISDPDEKHANEVEQTKLAIEAQIDEEGSTAPTVSATEKKSEEDSTIVTKSHEEEEKDTTVEGIISIDEVLEKDEAGDRCDQNTKNFAELQSSKEHEYSEGLAVDIVQDGQLSVQPERKVDLILISNTDAEKSDATSNVQNVQFGSVSHSYEPIISNQLADPFPERSSDIVTSGGPNVTSTRAVYQPETRNVVQPDTVTQYIPQQPSELYRGPVTSERYFPVQPEQQNYSPRRLSSTAMPYIGSQVIARETGPSLTVYLRRPTPERSWGFSFIGGAESGCPPFVSKVLKSSLAFQNGMEVGDVVVSICNALTVGKTYEQLKAEILRAGNELDLILIRRGIDLEKIRALFPQLLSPPLRSTQSFHLTDIDIRGPRSEQQLARGRSFRSFKTKSFRMLEEQIESGQAVSSALANKQHFQGSRGLSADGSPSSFTFAYGQDQQRGYSGRAETIQPVTISPKSQGSWAMSSPHPPQNSPGSGFSYPSSYHSQPAWNQPGTVSWETRGYVRPPMQVPMHSPPISSVFVEVSHPAYSAEISPYQGYPNQTFASTSIRLSPQNTSNQWTTGRFNRQ